MEGLTEAGLDGDHSDCKHYRPRLLPAIHQASLNNKESVIVSSAHRSYFEEEGRD